MFVRSLPVMNQVSKPDPKFQAQLRLRYKPFEGIPVEDVPEKTRRLYGTFVNQTGLKEASWVSGKSGEYTYSPPAPDKPHQVLINNLFFGISDADGADLIFPDRLMSLLVPKIKDNFGKIIEFDRRQKSKRVDYEFTQPENTIKTDDEFNAAREKLMAEYADKTAPPPAAAPRPADSETTQVFE